jgi:DNA-binding NarL/FixJ family response regulator
VNAAHLSSPPPAGPDLRGVRVLVVEDEGLVAEEISDRLSRLGATIVGVVDSAESAVDVAVQSHPDVALIDVRLRGESRGIEAALAIRRCLDTAIIYVTAHSDPATVLRAKSTGPVNYLIKPFSGSQLAVAVDIAVAGLRRDRSMPRHQPVADADAQARNGHLTTREQEVFAKIAQGLRNKEVAAALGISERTVKAHRMQIKAKMGVSTNAGLGRLASTLGL